MKGVFIDIEKAEKEGWEWSRIADGRIEHKKPEEFPQVDPLTALVEHCKQLGVPIIITIGGENNAS